MLRQLSRCEVCDGAKGAGVRLMPLASGTSLLATMLVLLAPLVTRASAQTGFVENLDRHRSNNVALLNLRLDKAFSIGRTRLTVMFDVANALNSSPVTNFNLLNDDFGHVIAVLDPRVAQVGLRLTF